MDREKKIRLSRSFTDLNVSIDIYFSRRCLTFSLLNPVRFWGVDFLLDTENFTLAFDKSLNHLGPMNTSTLVSHRILRVVSVRRIRVYRSSNPRNSEYQNLYSDHARISSLRKSMIPIPPRRSYSFQDYSPVEAGEEIGEEDPGVRSHIVSVMLRKAKNCF